MATRTPPRDQWACTKCGRPVTSGISPTIDPRYATGLCLHGKPTSEANPERVPLADKGKAESIIDERTYRQAVKRALRKQVTGQDLSTNDGNALAELERGRVAR